MKIMLLNDTGIFPHIGCLAVSDAHARMLATLGHSIKYRYFAGELCQYFDEDEKKSIHKVFEDNEFMEKIKSVDAVVVNGEGTIHHMQGLHYLAILAAAQEIGKKTLIVNAVFQDSYGFQRVYEKLDDFCVRDLFSSNFASKRGIKHRIVFDSFLGASFSELNDNYIDLAGKVVVTDWHPARDFDVGQTSKEYMHNNRDIVFYYPLFHGIHHFNWKLSLGTISTCDFVVTARHHGVYLAALAGKPFVALPSNTHKIEGIIAMSGLPIPICTNKREVEDGIQFCKENKSVFEEFTSFLRESMPLSTFKALSKENSKILPKLVNILLKKDDIRDNVEIELEKLQLNINKHSYRKKSQTWMMLNNDYLNLSSPG